MSNVTKVFSYWAPSELQLFEDRGRVVWGLFEDLGRIVQGASCPDTIASDSITSLSIWDTRLPVTVSNRLNARQSEFRLKSSIKAMKSI